MVNEWIKCKETLPPEGKYVLITDGEKIWIAFLKPNGAWDDGDFKDNITDITHWQYLPELPGAVGDKI